jgi:rhodanese-related sulfurtransferase
MQHTIFRSRVVEADGGASSFAVAGFQTFFARSTMMRSMFAAVTGVALMIGVASARADGVPMDIQGAKTVNADAVIELIQKADNLVVLDNRHAADFDAGHIEGAVRLIDTDLTAESVLAQHVKSKAAPVLFYCNGLKCGRAAKAATKAVEWGYSKVYYYAAGMDEWKQRGLPLTR